MWLLVENGNLVNLDLVNRVELHHVKKTASLFDATVPIFTDSAVAYEHFCTSADVKRVNWTASKTGDRYSVERNEG